MHITDTTRFHGAAAIHSWQVTLVLMIPVLMLLIPVHTLEIKVIERMTTVAPSEQSTLTPEGLKALKYTLSDSVPPEVQQYKALIEAAARKHDVAANLIAAVIHQESRGDAKALSYCGARGLMQLMPATAGDMGYAPDELWDPAKNIDAGTRYLSLQLRQFDGDIQLAAAAYNAGPGNVMKYGGVPEFAETQNYVIRVLQNLEDYAV